jgi:hypothetical protein
MTLALTILILEFEGYSSQCTVRPPVDDQYTSSSRQIVWDYSAIIWAFVSVPTTNVPISIPF